MLQPKRTKFRKAHKGRIKGNAKGGTALNFGAFGLKATTPERVTSNSASTASLMEGLSASDDTLNTTWLCSEDIVVFSVITGSRRMS